ncbi:hypothetical protein BH09BAC5_BH09BAC5_25320 [soil metagenome]
MKRQNKQLLDFEVDKLTRSIENVTTGESFATQVLPISNNELKLITKKNGWVFNWKKEFKDVRKEVYKLVTVENLSVIQGLVSFTIEKDHIFMNLIENAPFNRKPMKIYNGVAGNLVAFLCKLSFAGNGGGYVSFLSKTNLISHYQKSLGAEYEGGHLMVIYPPQSSRLIKQYFQNEL